MFLKTTRDFTDEVRPYPGTAVTSLDGLRLNPAPSWLLGIRELDVHRSNAEDGDDHRLFSLGRHAVVVPGACMAQDKSASPNRYSLHRREVLSAVDPPRSGHDHADAVSPVVVRRAEPARVPPHQHQVWAGLV